MTSARRNGKRAVKRDTAAVQAGLARIELRLRAIERQAKALHRAVPQSARRAEMQEDEIAPDVATDLVAAIECLLTDCLKPALRIAREASRLTEARLRRQWRKRQRQRTAASSARVTRSAHEGLRARESRREPSDSRVPDTQPGPANPLRSNAAKELVVARQRV